MSMGRAAQDPSMEIATFLRSGPIPGLAPPSVRMETASTGATTLTGFAKRYIERAGRPCYSWAPRFPSRQTYLARKTCKTTVAISVLSESAGCIDNLTHLRMGGTQWQI